MKQQHLGLIILALAIAMSAVSYWFTTDLNSYLHNYCTDVDGSCPHAGSLPPQSYVAFTLDFVLAVFGIYLLRPPPASMESQVSLERKAELERASGSLEGEEKQVFGIVLREGLVFQGKLISETGFSKVKVSRILDRLEAKKLIERRRRGMSNVVVPKG